MMNNEENLLTVKAEGVEAICRLEKEIKALKKALTVLDNEVEASEATAVTEAGAPCVCESVFDDENIADFWFRWDKNCDKVKFAGFVDYDMPGTLAVGNRYGLSIGPVALIGERIQMLVMLFTDEDWEDNTLDSPAGLLIEEYKIGTEEFKSMATAVFAPFHESVISVEVDRICDAFGTIGLKEVDGKLGLDWKSFDPEQTPQSQAFEFSWSLADRIKKLSA